MDNVLRRFEHTQNGHSDVANVDDGRLGVPSLSIYTLPVVYAHATRSFKTRSSSLKAHTGVARQIKSIVQPSRVRIPTMRQIAQTQWISLDVLFAGGNPA